MSDTDVLRARIDELLDAEGITVNRTLVRRILATGVELGRDGTERLDLKITAAAVEEMRTAFRLFAPWDGASKVTVFGSARTKEHDPLYAQAEQVAASLARLGWMVVTGAGPGIMQAAAEGAGPELSIGVSIRLPFEEKPSAMVEADPNRVTMKYFFTRKLMLMKESRGFVSLPGGFGTLDETFEVLTLRQTGKIRAFPVVLVGTGYWNGLLDWLEQPVRAEGKIDDSDVARIVCTDDLDEVLEIVEAAKHRRPRAA